MDDDPERRARAMGRTIRRLRAAAGLCLADLAAAGEISRTTLHGIEQGPLCLRPRWDAHYGRSARPVCRVCGVGGFR